MPADTPQDEVLRDFTRRYRHFGILRNVMLDAAKHLMQGNRAAFLEKPECRELAEVTLWVCHSKNVVLASPIKR